MSVKVEFITEEQDGKERYAVFNPTGTLLGYARINALGGLDHFNVSNRFKAEILNAIEKEKGGGE